jgi:hypothetical protein
MRLRWAIGGVLLLLCLAAGCGGGDNEPSDAALRDHLLPASEVKDFKFHRSYIFTNAVDAGVQGLQLSENTQPSDVVDALEDDGFVKGAGEELQEGGFHGPIVGIDAWKFDSDSGAQKALDLVHDEYRKQPCYGICSQKTSDMDVEGIPDARGEASEPDPARPPETGPGFEAYAVQFTIGPYLYIIAGGGEPGFDMKETVLDAAQKQYARVKDL